jgi:hypothetical protein
MLKGVIYKTNYHYFIINFLFLRGYNFEKLKLYKYFFIIVFYIQNTITENVKFY